MFGDLERTRSFSRWRKVLDFSFENSLEEPSKVQSPCISAIILCKGRHCKFSNCEENSKAKVSVICKVKFPFAMDKFYYSKEIHRQ